MSIKFGANFLDPSTTKLYEIMANDGILNLQTVSVIEISTIINITYSNFTKSIGPTVHRRLYQNKFQNDPGSKHRIVEYSKHL